MTLEFFHAQSHTHGIIDYLMDVSPSLVFEILYFPDLYQLFLQKNYGVLSS